MKRLLLVSSVLVALVAPTEIKATPTPSPPPQSGSGPKPFLSAVSKIIDPPPPSPTPIKFVSQYASPSPTLAPPASPSATPVKPQVKFRPKKDGVEEPLYDAPWAVHIPIEVPFEGGAARITWQARVSWENPPPEWYEQKWSLGACGEGIYRMDGKRLQQNAIRRNASGLKWEADAPLPTYIWDATYSIAGEKEKHKPMTGIEDDSLVVDPVLPGWYAIWFALRANDAWPQKEPKREFLQGTIHFDCIVSRGADGPTSAEKEYLFGGGKRPDKMQDDKFYKITAVDVPFKLRRDSWEFDHAEVHLRPDEREKIDKKRVGSGGTYNNYKVSEKVGGKDVELNLTEKIQSDPRSKATSGEIPDNDSAFDTVYIWDEKWKASFPPSFPDYSFGKVQFSGGREGKYQQKGQFGTSAQGSYSYWAPAGPSMVRVPEYAGQFWIHTVRDPRSKDAQSAEKQEKDDVAKKYGKDALEWFVPDYFEDYKYAGVKKGESQGQYIIQAERPLLNNTTLELGAFPLVEFTVGPWEICGFYKRLSEIENRVVASKVQPGETTIVSDEDDFWKWYVGLDKVLREQLPIATEAEIHAIHEGTPLPSLIKSRGRLMLAMGGDSESSPHGLEQVWDAKDKVWHWMDNEFPKLNVGTLPGGSEPGSVNTPVKGSPNIGKKIYGLTTEIEQHRQHILEDTKKAQAAYEKINAKLKEGDENFGGPAHGELFLWRKHYRETLEQVPIKIALASQDPEILRRALQDASKRGESADTFVLQAELYKAGGDAISALDALRRAVTLDKDHILAQTMLADVECAFLQCAIDKSQGAIAQARNHFYGYLAERGFSDRDILASATKPKDWLATRMNVYGEEAWAVLTTGLFGSFSAFYGKPAAEAELLATTERQMTTAFIGLHTMRLLRKRGVTFDEMRKMPSFEIRDRLGMRDHRGQPLSDAAAANLGVAIREAMKLPDIQALLAEDADGLRDGVKQGYWDAKDVSNTWIEWFGDLTSAYNLFTLLLPGAMVGTEGRATGLLWDSSEAKMMSELQTLGQVTSGTEALANTIGVSRALNAIGATDGGKMVVKFLRGLEEYQAALGAFDQAVWTTGKITGAITFGYLTVSATEKLAGHKAAMLVAAALMFANDTDLLVKLLEGRNIPPKAIGSVIISDYLPATKVHIKRLAAMEKTEVALLDLFGSVKAGRRLSEADHKFLNTHFGSDWRRLLPGATASENARIPLLAAGEGAGNSVNNGAIKAAEEIKPEVKAEAEAAQKTAEEEQKVADALNKAVTEPNPPAAPAPAVVSEPATDPNVVSVDQLSSAPPGVEKPRTAQAGAPPPERQLTGKIGGAAEPVAPRPRPRPPKLTPPKPEYPPADKRVLPEEIEVPGQWGGYVIDPPLRGTSKTAEAMQLMENGQYARAERKFIEIQDLIRDGVVTEAEEMTLERLHMFRMAANDLQRVKRIPVPAESQSLINAPIRAATVDEVLGNPSVNSLPAKLKKIEGSKGAMSEAFEVEGHPELFVKKIRSEFERLDTKTGNMVKETIDVLADVENNLVHEQLARAMGFDVPAMEVRVIYNADGQAVEAYYVMRKVKGRTLDELTPGEIYLYRDELARHRSLSVLIGDYDRKLDNYIITEDGRFVPIDPGCADVAGARLRRWCDEKKIPFQPDHPDTIGGRWGRDHWYANSIALAPGEEILTQKKTIFRKFLTVEEAMTFQGAEPAVIEIEKLFVNGSKATEAEARIALAYSKMEVPRLTKRLAELRNANLADPAVRAALEQEVIQMQATRSNIHDKVAEVMKNLKARAPHIRDCMKGLNERNGIPLFETTTGSSHRLHLDNDFIVRLVLQHFVRTIIMRKAHG